MLADYRQRRAMAEAAKPSTLNVSSGSSDTSSKTKEQSSKIKTADSGTTQASEFKPLTESQMNTLGYQLLRLKRVKDAIAVFKQNTVDFPNGYNTWDSLAEGYMIDGDKESAIKYYKKSLELNPDNTNAVQKLKELGVGN